MEVSRKNTLIELTDIFACRTDELHKYVHFIGTSDFTAKNESHNLAI